MSKYKKQGVEAMTPEEVREYAKNVQKAESAQRVLGPLNDWYMGKCIRKIDWRIKNRAKDGGTDISIRFSDFLVCLYDADKKYLVEHYRNQGYYVEKGPHSIRIGWSVRKPWWIY